MSALGRRIPVSLQHRVLACFPASLHPTLEPTLQMLLDGADAAAAQAALTALAAIPDVRLFPVPPHAPAEPLHALYSVQVSGVLYVSVQRRTDDLWHLTSYVSPARQHPRRDADLDAPPVKGAPSGERIHWRDWGERSYAFDRTTHRVVAWCIHTYARCSVVIRQPPETHGPFETLAAARAEAEKHLLA